MPMLVTKNMRNREMYNMQQYKIDKIEENVEGNLEFTLNGQAFSHSEFRESSIPAFCVTVYRYQGSTITEPYNIYDAEKMNKKQLYTSLTRTTKLDHIHLMVNSYLNDDYECDYYSEKYGDCLLNKQSVPKQTVKIEYKHQAQIETENQLRDRLRQKFGDELKIKDDPMNKLLYYDAKTDGKRCKTMARYTKQSKEEVMSKITKKQQQLIGELTIQWE